MITTRIQEYSLGFLLYTYAFPIYHQWKSTYFTGVNRTLCQQVSFLKKLKKLAVGAKKS